MAMQRCYTSLSGLPCCNGFYINLKNVRAATML